MDFICFQRKTHSLYLLWNDVHQLVPQLIIENDVFSENWYRCRKVKIRLCWLEISLTYWIKENWCFGLKRRVSGQEQARKRMRNWKRCKRWFWMKYKAINLVYRIQSNYTTSFDFKRLKSSMQWIELGSNQIESVWSDIFNSHLIKRTSLLAELASMTTPIFLHHIKLTNCGRKNKAMSFTVTVLSKGR